ncbi:hypothetical protein ACVGW4_00500, partial [Enterobacter hormaechei]
MDIPHGKNNNLRLLPAGPPLPRASVFVAGLRAPPPGNSNPKANTTRTPGMMKKLLAQPLVAPLLVSCSSKKGDEYNEAWVKDT